MQVSTRASPPHVLPPPNKFGPLAVHLCNLRKLEKLVVMQCKTIENDIWFSFSFSFQFSVFSFRFQFSFLSFAPFLRSCSVFSPFFSFFFFFSFFLLLFSLLIANCSFASDKQQSTQDWGLHYKTTWGLGMVRLLRTGLGLGVGLGLWSCSCIQIFLIKCLMAMRRGFNCTWLRAYRQME